MGNPSTKSMNRTLTLVLGAALVMAIVALLPFRFIEHAEGISTLDIECGLIGARATFDNPIERILYRKIVVTEKKGNIVTATAYSFGGAPLSRSGSECINGTWLRAWRI